jgi:AraC-like DNA-binding protein
MIGRRGPGVLPATPHPMTETPARGPDEGVPIDPLSDLLRLIRLEGALFLHGEFHEPWCVDAPEAVRMAPLLRPGARQLAILHMVLEGRCWLQAPGTDPVALGTGDVVALPRGDAHLIGSGLQHAPVDLAHVVPVDVPCLRPLRYGGSGDGCVLVCGWFAWEHDLPNPLLASLPRVFRSPVGARPGAAWLVQSLRYALEQAAAGGPGSSAVAAKVAESLFVETVRAYVEQLSPQHSGWLAGLRDPLLGRCLALLHERPADDWTVETLAQAVHVSRSVLAERFSAVLGVPPMQYLKRWRLALAARMLASERAHLGQVAQAVGYDSEAAFSRAFKAEYGLAPGQWRLRRGAPAIADDAIQG